MRINVVADGCVKHFYKEKQATCTRNFVANS